MEHQKKHIWTGILNRNDFYQSLINTSYKTVPNGYCRGFNLALVDCFALFNISDDKQTPIQDINYDSLTDIFTEESYDNFQYGYSCGITKFKELLQKSIDEYLNITKEDDIHATLQSKEKSGGL